MGYDFTWGRISHFPIDFCMGLTTVQRKGAACDFDHALDPIIEYVYHTYFTTKNNGEL